MVLRNDNLAKRAPIKIVRIAQPCVTTNRESQPRREGLALLQYRSNAKCVTMFPHSELGITREANQSTSLSRSLPPQWPTIARAIWRARSQCQGNSLQLAHAIGDGTFVLGVLKQIEKHATRFIVSSHVLLSVGALSKQHSNDGATKGQSGQAGPQKDCANSSNVCNNK